MERVHMEVPAYRLPGHPPTHLPRGPPEPTLPNWDPQGDPSQRPGNPPQPQPGGREVWGTEGTSSLGVHISQNQLWQNQSSYMGPIKVA